MNADQCYCVRKQFSLVFFFARKLLRRAMGSNTVSHSGAGNKQPSLAELHPGKMKTQIQHILSLSISL